MVKKSISIAHIINAVKVPETSDLFVAQPITFESMRVAKDLAKEVKVELYSTHYPEDDELVPDYFTKTSLLERSVLDVAQFNKQRKLPILKDILDRVYEASDAEYLIYTNVDITLMPHFYEAVASIIGQGHDAFMINRRRLPAIYKSPKDLPLIWSEIGKPHPGFDCFVFHRDLYPKFKLGEVCIGIPFIEATLAHNLYAFANNFKLFDNLHLTIHLGMKVMVKHESDYYWHNRNQFNELIKVLKPQLKAGALPYSDEGFIKRTVKRGLNPSIFTKLALELETKGFTDKAHYLLQEIRFKILGPRE